MEPCNIAVATQDFVEARRVMSECWIFTEERGLRAVTMHGNGASIAIEGRRLQRWCILDDSVPRAILAYLYCAEKPSSELREQVAQLARTRFATALTS